MASQQEADCSFRCRSSADKSQDLLSTCWFFVQCIFVNSRLGTDVSLALRHTGSYAYHSLRDVHGLQAHIAVDIKFLYILDSPQWRCLLSVQSLSLSSIK
jgi:hypothetical protein